MTNNKNFPVTVEGKEYWISRSCAVCAILAVKDDNDNWCILANKRGPGCPDNVGKWNIPCGYLDFNETGSQAVSREIFEETGVHVKPGQLKLFGVNYDLKHRQNVTHRYISVHEYRGSINDFPIGHGTGGEENEVDDIRYIDIHDIDKYEWAFGHDVLIKNALTRYVSNNLNMIDDE